MAKYQGSYDMNLLGNHWSGSSNSDNSGEGKENMKSPNQRKEGPLVCKKRNREIASKIEKKSSINGKYQKSKTKMR